VRIGAPTLAWTDSEGTEWLVQVHLVAVGGRAECVGLELRSFRSEHGGERFVHPDFPTEEAAARVVTASLLRQLPAGQLIGEAKKHEAYIARTWATSKGASPELRRAARGAGVEAGTVAYWKTRRDKARRQLAALEKGRGGRPRLYDADHFANVAKVYLGGGDTPTMAVAEYFNLSRSAAAKQVARARKLGLLAETTKGKTSGLPPGEPPRRRKTRSGGLTPRKKRPRKEARKGRKR
jgi:hypothetical protein